LPHPALAVEVVVEEDMVDMVVEEEDMVDMVVASVSEVAAAAVVP
jgi:hypothetical protein